MRSSTAAVHSKHGFMLMAALLAAVAIGLTVPPDRALGEEATYETTSPRYLFIDRQHVQRISETVEHVFHQPVKADAPVLVPEEPWEGRGFNRILGGPMWCDGRSAWRMWYIGGSDGLPLYAESEDGLTWVRPRLGLVEWNGSKQNNIIDLGPEFEGKSNRVNIWRDDRDPDPTRRFKGLSRDGGRMKYLVSADGLTWRLIGEGHRSGDEYALGYDAIHHRFLATLKIGGGSRGGVRGEFPVIEFGRAVSLSVSEDFETWTEPELIFWADEVDQRLGRQRMQRAVDDPDLLTPRFVNPSQFYTDVYNMPIFTYEDLYLALPTMFNHSGPRAVGNQDGIMYPQLIASRDLHTWDRLDREPFIPPSRLSESGRFDHGQLFAYPPVHRGDELWFYYWGARYTHGEGRGFPAPGTAFFLARLRVDGFASLHADDEPGLVLTQVVEVTGPNLYVNVDAGGGELRAEIRDARTGASIDGYSLGDIMGPRHIADEPLRWRVGAGARHADDPVENQTVAIRGNTTAAPVQWQDKRDVSALIGQKVRISFYLRNAHLYSFWFDE